MRDMVLPSFAMDCRDWLVNTPAEAGLPDEVGGAPLLAVLSTVLLDAGDFVPASGVLTVGLLDEDVPAARCLGAGCVARELLDADVNGLRYLLPAPEAPLALLAEFHAPEGPDARIVARVGALMRSFRWAA
ncbi:MAG: hypothetical protein ACRDNS_03910 [Trebonia sp.]